jgi:hypothetical protein
MVGVMVLKTLDDMTGMLAMASGRMVFAEGFWVAAAIMITMTTALTIMITNMAQKCAKHTLVGKYILGANLKDE